MSHNDDSLNILKDNVKVKMDEFRVRFNSEITKMPDGVMKSFLIDSFNRVESGERVDMTEFINQFKNMTDADRCNSKGC